MTTQLGLRWRLWMASTPVAARDAWVDEARGLAILLVVFGHTWRGVQAAGLMSDGTTFWIVDQLIYSFHMPMFFVLSGLFLERVLLKGSATEVLKTRVIRLLWPLVLWSYVFAAFRASAGTLANQPLDWASVIAAPFPPKWHFWFLWALFLLQVVLLAFRPLLVASRGRVGTWLAIFGIAVILALAGPRGTGIWAALVAPALFNAPFLVLGALIGKTGALSPRPSIPMAAGALVAFIAAEALALSAPGTLSARLVIGAVASVAACALVFQTGEIVGRGRGLVLLGHLGRASMAIFLAHTIFSAALRILLEQMGISNVLLHVLAGTAIGILGPLVVLAVARRTGTAGLLGI